LRSYEQAGVVAEIRAAGGEVYGITSEPHSLAVEAEDAWEMSIPVVGDPHHEIREDLKARGWLDIFYNADYGHLRERDWASHPKGYYQPATIAIDKSGRVLYRWRCVPKFSNMSGAGARPEARYTWNQVRTAMAEPGDAEPDQDPVMGAESLSWFRFLVILIAHGWFIRPRAFPLVRNGGKGGVTPKMALRRAYFFVGAWLVALLVLPLVWVGAAFFAWLIALSPGLIEIHRQFQNEPDVF
jgi:peroxiredoxin